MPYFMRTTDLDMDFCRFLRRQLYTQYLLGSSEMVASGKARNAFSSVTN